MNTGIHQTNDGHATTLHSPTSSSSKDVLFPGLAADARVFSGVEYRTDAFVTVDYHQIDFTQPLDAALEDLIRRFRITSADRLIATSFGGILAARVAKVLKSEKLHLVGAVVNPEEIGSIRGLFLRTRLYRAIGLGSLPKWLVKSIFGIRTQECAQVFFAMFASYDTSKINEMLGFLASSPNLHFRWASRVHGARDLVVPKPRTPCVMMHAGHIVSMRENGQTDGLAAFNARLGSI